jgi:hypothetical protein
MCFQTSQRALPKGTAHRARPCQHHTHLQHVATVNWSTEERE